jgi:hypothetical protein
MTFLEAAIEVLRNESEALHFSEIAQRAVKRDLLSHVGRDPETAMKSCLTSAVRGNPDGALLMRSKPGHYMVKPGAELPPPPPAAEEAPKKKATKKKATKKATKKTVSKTAAKKTAKKATKKAAKKTAKKSARKAADEGQSDAPEDGDAPSEVNDLDGASESDSSETSGSTLSFEAPSGSGLEGPTDIALVMANAMSRLVDERPELKGEFEAMQTRSESGTAEEGPTIERRSDRGRTREDRGEAEERGGRRRRRRRKRGRKVEWSASAPQAKASPQGLLLDELAKVLTGAGAKSLHVRQLAEQLANVEALGGDISELERAATAAMLVDIRRFGSGSRFLARGDARFQLRGSRVPQEAAAAEQAVYASVRALDDVTRKQLGAWLMSLGARALEAVARIYLEHERLPLRQSTSPARGVARLWVDDPEAEGESKTLVLIVPSATAVERRLWEGEDVSESVPVLLFAMGSIPDDLPARVRPVGVDETVRWMIENGVGIRQVRVEVPSLDPALIESIRGLDA